MVVLFPNISTLNKYLCSMPDKGLMPKNVSEIINAHIYSFFIGTFRLVGSFIICPMGIFRNIHLTLFFFYLFKDIGFFSLSYAMKNNFEFMN